MLTHADARSKKRRSEWEKKAHYYAPEDAESLLPEGDDIGPVTHLSRSTSAYWCMCLLPEGDDIGPASHLFRITSRITSAYWCMCLLPEGRDIGPVLNTDLALTSTRVPLLFQYTSTNTDGYSARESTRDKVHTAHTRHRPKAALYIRLQATICAYLPLYECASTTLNMYLHLPLYECPRPTLNISAYYDICEARSREYATRERQHKARTLFFQ